MLCNYCHVGIVDKHHHVNVLKSLPQPTYRALQLISDHLGDSHIRREDLGMLSVSKSFMLGYHKSFLSTMFKHDTRCIDTICCVMNCTVTYEQEYDVPSIQV